MSIPITYFHVGSGWEYLKISIEQVKRRNPDTDIHVLCDEGIYDHINKEILPKELEEKDDIQTKPYMIYEFMRDKKTVDFLNNFVNYSTNNHDFEKMCILRWFVINNWMEQWDIERIFYCDSDTMLYCDINEKAKNYENSYFTVTNNISLGISFINDKKILDKLTNIIYNTYNKKDKFLFDKIYSHYKCLQDNNKQGGVNDMSFVEILRKDAYFNPGMVQDTSQIIDNTTFDHNINQSDGFEMKDGIKNIKWKDKDPYVYHEWLKRDIKFNLLHFQGYHMKQLMKDYIS